MTVLSVVFIMALVLRLVGISQSLWLDEATTAKVVQQFNFWEIITKFSPNDFHPPLYYLLMKLWTGIFGYSEVALRMPSVLFSLLTGYLVYRSGKLIKSERVGLWASVFFLFNPLIIYYSQETRMYMMTTLLSTASLYFLLKSLGYSKLNQSLNIKAQKSKPQLKNQNYQYVFLFSFFSSLSFFTFYGSFFLLVPMLIYLLYKKEYKVFIVSCFMLCVTCLILSPLLYQQLINAKQQVALVANWKAVLGNANLKNLLLIPIKFSIGRISFEPKIFYWLVSGMWTTAVFGTVIIGGFKNRLLLFLLVSPIVLAIIFSIFTPLLQYFRFLYLVPIMSVLMALGCVRLHRYSLKWVLLTVFVIFSLTYLLNPGFYREDWKSLASSLKKDSEVYMIVSSSDPLNYYRQDIKIKDLKELDKETGERKELVIIPYTAEIHGLDYRKILLAKNYQLTREITFRGLKIENWKF